MVLSLLTIAGVVLLLLLSIGKVPLRYNFRNLTIRWKTTIMTALAFTAVIALLTVMMAFVNGMQRLTNGTGQPGNVLVLSDGATDEIISNLTVGDLSDIENLPEVVRENGRPMTSRETFFVANQPVPGGVEGRPKRRYLQIRGVENPQAAARVHGLELLPGGNWFSGAGVQASPSASGAATPAGRQSSLVVPPLGGIAAVKPAEAGTTNDVAVAPAATPLVQAVLGEGVAHELGRSRTKEERAAARNPDRLDVGDTFLLRDRQWIVVGVLKSAGMTFNSEIWAKRSLAGALFGKDYYTTLVLQTEDANAAARLKKFLSQDYKKARRERDGGRRSITRTSRRQTAQFSWAIAFLAVCDVSRRRLRRDEHHVRGREPADRRHRRTAAAGLCPLANPRLIPAGIAGHRLGGRAVGLRPRLALRRLVGHQHRRQVMAGAEKMIVLQLAVDANIIAGGILLTLLMGLLGGLFPALSAMRLKPLEALR